MLGKGTVLRATMASGDGGTGRESRFAQLLQPNKDLASNWTVDVCKQLESYLAELAATGLFDHSSLNFAEAALLIQGSIQVYSRKVEYLYALVLQALNFLAEKKQGQDGERSSQEIGQEGNAAEEKEEEEFLNLDEVPEETNIDIVDDDGLNSITPALKLPASLLSTEAESVDVPGEAGELATYQIATSTMHRTFLLLDPADAETVDKYLDSKNGRREGGEASTATTPPSGLHRDCTTPGGREGGPMQKSANLGTPQQVAGGKENITTPGERPDWEGEGNDGDDGMLWDDLHVEERIHQELDDQVPDTVGSGAAPAENDYVDPWAPLNPHEPGTLTIQPFKKGPTQRKIKLRKDRGASLPIPRRNGVCFPEFDKALQARQRKERAERRGEEPSFFENLRSSDAGPAIDVAGDPLQEGGLDGIIRDSDGEDNDDWTGTYEAPDHNDLDSVEPNASFYPSQDEPEVNLFMGRQDVPNFDGRVEEDNMSLEELCQVHLEAILQKLAASQVRSGLAARVSSWKNKIQATLEHDETRPAFDIHAYGDHLLARLSASAATRSLQGKDEVQESFSYLVNGQPKEQVARFFSALLQLVNNGNVRIDKGSVDGKSYCFTGETPFTVKLLSAQNCHEGMFEHMDYHPAPNASSKSRLRHQQSTDHTAGPSQVGMRSPAIPLKTPVPVSNRCSPSLNPPSSQRSRGKAPPVFVSARLSPLSYLKSPHTILKVRSSTALRSPVSMRRNSRKRGQSLAGKVIDVENEGMNTPEKVYTPVKLTPNRRQSKRKPLQTIQA